MASPSQTAAVYDKIAEHWDHPGFDHSNGIAQHERALGFASSAGSALDVGCGPNGRIVSLLLQHGFEVTALDVSAEMLRRARLHNPGVTFHHADICTWRLPHSYDFISAWDSIWHVPLDRQLAVIRKLCGALSAPGVLIFSTGGVDEPGEVTATCFGQPLYHATPGIPAILRTLEASDCQCRHFEFDHGPGDKHAYFIAQRV
jgi:SAM-dependent methyltransferase